MGNGLCECGCGANAPIAKMTNTKFGHRQGEPVRFIKGHHGRRPLAEKFWEKVRKTDGCWEWIGATVARYGVLYVGEGDRLVAKKAHRLSWEMQNGPIPPGMLMCHTCDNPPCVNPAHLFLGTIADNNLDREAKGRGWNPQSRARKAQTHCIHGHAFTVENTYLHHTGPRRTLVRKCRACRIATSARRKAQR